MQFLRSLYMLIWKNWVLHKRHFIITGFEILPPVLISVLMLYIVKEMPNAFDKQGIVQHNYTNYSREEPALSLKSFSYDTIWYAPNTSATRTLMNMTFWDTSLNPVGFDSEQTIVKEREKDNPLLWGAVIFSEFGEDDVPSVLKYKLRPRWNFLDDIGKSYYDDDPTYRIDDYTYMDHKYVLGVQALIDISYIKLRQEENPTKADVKVFVKKMPYPPYKSLKSNFSPLILMPSMIISGFLVAYIIITRRIVEEKNNRAKEMMKMMGLSTPAYWAGTFISNFIVMLIISLMIVAIFVIPVNSGYSVLQGTSFLLFFVTLLLFCASSLLLCFVISTLFTKASIAAAVIVLVSVATQTTSSLVFTDLKAAYLGKVFSCLLPNMAITLAGIIISINAASGQSAQWDNIFEPPFGSPDSFCLATVLGMMFCSCLLYTVLLLYLDTVWPWQPGVPKSPLFFLHPSYWSYARMESEEECIVDERERSEYFEIEPVHSTPSVVITCLSKAFETGSVTKMAVDNLSLNLYPGQITALLGHNGAGKTTTMNILTGIFPPTKGSVSINGHDIVKDTSAARSNLGLCPQHNVLYDTLTVEEHLKLFAGLKGMPRSAMSREIPKLIEQLGLQQKAKTVSKELSGGMKRKLSLGNAVIGGPQIVILDEPTTGLDPEARRVIWDMLERLRTQCTILLTTHYMEEADTLGDRIAIMASGTVQCCGSPMFLKRKFGAGYQLRIEKGRNCNVSGITDLVKSHVPQATLITDVKLELIVSLSNTSEQFNALFLDIERSSDDLGIASYGVTVTTMDDVFLKVGQMTEEQYKSNENEYLASDVSGTVSMHRASKSKPALFQQMKALVVKHLYYSRRHLSLMIFQILLPMVAVTLYLYLNFSPAKKQQDSFDLNLDALFKDKKSGFYHCVDNSTAEANLLATYYNKTLEKEHVEVIKLDPDVDPDKYLIKRGTEGVDSYVRDYLVGSSINSSEEKLVLTAWYNGIQYNVDPVSLNLMTTSLLRYTIKNMSENIYVTIHPLSKEDDDYTPQVSQIRRIFNPIFLVLGLSFLSASAVLLPIQERITKAKLLQTMCGVNAVVYWLTHLSWDYLVHLCSSLLLLVPFVIYHGLNGFIASEAVGAVFLCLLLYGLSSTTLAYLVSFFPKLPSTGFSILIIVNALFGIAITLTMSALTAMPYANPKVKLVMWFMRLFPSFTATWGINKIHTNSLKNIECLGYKKDELYEKCIALKFGACCTDQVLKGKGYHALAYLSWEDGAGKECLFLFLTFIIWSGIIILIETVLPKICYRIIEMIKQRNRIDGREVTLSTMPNEDSDVSRERQRIEDVYNRHAMNSEALLVMNLKKTFGSLHAVNNLTFGVHKEECFGLLGINGAGKTTTFRMLVGDLFPTVGDAYIDSSSVQHSLQKFQMSVGYCPQFDALIDRLTAREILELFAHLRGIPGNEINRSVNQMISMCDLDAYADKQTRSYSGGTKRKLSLAIALIGAPPVVLLDEPTAGVDPASRRKIWKTLSSMKQMLGVSFILTSHSMDECESLCNRIAIMVNGEFQCLGAMQSLKTKFGQGYSIIIKLKQEDNLNTAKAAEIRLYIEKHFPSASLKVEYQGTLHYHLTDVSTKWSTMFAIMEEAKQKFQLEDYVLSGTTLEQIFLAFARTQAGLV